MNETQIAKFLKLTYVEDTSPPAMQHLIYARLAPKCKDEDLDQAVAEELAMRAIFNTNCVAMGTRSQWGTGVFELYSRINHSCTLRTQRKTPLETDQGCLRLTDQENSRDIAKLIRSVGSDKSRSVELVGD